MSKSSNKEFMDYFPEVDTTKKNFTMIYNQTKEQLLKTICRTGRCPGCTSVDTRERTNFMTTAPNKVVNTVLRNERDAAERRYRDMHREYVTAANNKNVKIFFLNK